MTIGVCRNGHKRTAKNTRISAAGEVRCIICQTANNQRSRAKKSVLSKQYSVPDGWEDEFGPAPERAGNSTWYDEVIVHRALNGYSTGRRPFPLEAQAILAGMNSSHDGESVSELCGLQRTAVARWIQRWGKPSERAS